MAQTWGPLVSDRPETNSITGAAYPHLALGGCARAGCRRVRARAEHRLPVGRLCAPGPGDERHNPRVVSTRPLFDYLPPRRHAAHLEFWVARLGLEPAALPR